ncbi:MAG TPA: HlyD family efflux transporter periplasmic adaptor subunit [Clostridia bacterium]|nr:HlyD family efflux transporter periplasmic adaptor subunit [Clostridia bacterium]
MARRFRVKGRFYAFLLALLLIGGVVIGIVVSGRNASVVRAGVMTARMEGMAVIIRDEQCVGVDKYDRVSFYVDEGAAVTDAQDIALVYKWGYSDDMMQALLTVEGQIYAAQTALLAGVENADLASIELQIQNKRLAVRQAELGEGGDLLTLQRELAELLNQRAAFLTQTVQPTSALTELYNTQAERLAQLDTYREKVTAAGTGRVSFYFDGYEQTLNTDKLDTINASLISGVVSGSSDLLSGAPSNLVYRLVNPNLWYLAFVTPRSQALRLAAGERYTITFSDCALQFAGTAMNASASEGDVLNLIEITEDMGELYRTRKLNATVAAELSGYLIPLKYVGVKDGSAFVTVDAGDSERTIEISVVAVDGDTALVRALSADGSLAAGMRCVKP